MHLVYAYIKKFKNYENQEILFDRSYAVSVLNQRLLIKYLGDDQVQTALRNGRKPDHLHLLVGKTGSGKTNLLQLIGMKYDVRSQRKWDGEEDSYFLLYKINSTEFFAEICDLDIQQFPAEPSRDVPAYIRENARRIDTIRSVRFRLKAPLEERKVYSAFTIIQEYGQVPNKPEESARDICLIHNSYDIHAFLQPPYPDEQETYDDFQNEWLGRMVMPYHRTALWQVCDYIREYLSDMEPGKGKRQTAFVLSTHNFAHKYPQQLPESIAHEYWTFFENRQEEEIIRFEAEIRGKKVPAKKKTKRTNKEMFLHDLWTDYAIYLRKWIETIHSYSDSIPEENLDASGTVDVYQEFIDYYTQKEYLEDIDPTQLPDGRKMSIVKRCTWLAEYIDRKDNRDPHGMLWQIIDDIKDIGKILSKLDDKYFTIDTFSIPVVDMALEENRILFEDLFERMEAYRADDAGIFTDRLLPYSFTHLSTGEYQYAKVLGALEVFLTMSCTSGTRRKMDKIVLLDEPEAYMHPELARQFMKKLYELTARHQDDSTLQIIISTHSPFMMSDVLPLEITRLDIDKATGNAIVLSGSDKPYFGANIHTILADSFFLEYTIGEYSRIYLQEAFDRMKTYLETNALDDQAWSDIHRIKQLLPNIGDSLIRRAFELTLMQLEHKEGMSNGTN